jgi:hypothetical protein
MTMLKRIALATAAAGFLAAAALPSTASAAGGYGQGGYNQGGGYSYFQFGGNGWNFGFANPPPPRPVCRPIVKNVKWWDNWGYPHFSQVVVGQNCGGYGQGGYRKRPHPQQWGGGGDWRGNNGAY